MAGYKFNIYNNEYYFEKTEYLTAKLISNLYVYGTDMPISSESGFINSTNTIPKIVLNTSDYMLNGPGRYALPAASPEIRAFMLRNDNQKMNLPDGVYTKYDLTNYGYNIKDFNIYQKQFNIDTSSYDYFTRTYIYNSTAYTVSQNRKFISNVNNRYIVDIEIRPYNDNFNFITEPGITQIGNDLLLRPLVDPKNMGNKINIYFDKTLGFYVENYVLSDFYDDDIRLDEAFDAFGPMVFAAMVVEDKATHDLGGSSQLTPSLVAFPDGALSRSIGNMSALDRGNDAINFDYLNLDYLYNYSLYDLSGVSDYVGDMDVSYIYADDLSNVDWNYGYSYASSYGVEPSYAAYLNNDSFESGADFGGLGVNFYSQGVSVGFTFQFPIVLDLNGDGISITQRDTSTV